MRRSRGGGAVQRPEGCDVWLDTAELKQSAAQSLIAKSKAPKGLLERKHASVAFTQARASRPRTKQTTISAFFSAQTDEKDKENSRPSPLSLSKDCKEKGISLAASSVKILALPRMEEAQKRPHGAEEETVQVPPQRYAQKAPASPTPFPDTLLPQAESRSKSEASCAAGEDCWCFGFTQDSEGNRIIAHRNTSDFFAGETFSASGSGISKREGQPPPEEAKTGLDFQPRLGANRDKKPRPSSNVNSLIDFSETENINPAVMRDSTGAAAFCSSPKRPAGALRERSQNAGAGPGEEGGGGRTGLSGQLFTQDSEGNRVIAHGCREVPSPRRDGGGSGGQLPRSPGQGCCRAAAGRGLSQPGQQRLDVCYDSLFTQDSEGNRVIKHW